MKKVFLKRALALSLALATVIGVCGCTQKEPATGNPSSVTDTDSKASSKEAEKKPVKLVLGSNAGFTSSADDKNYPYATITEMEKRTGVTLEIQAMDSEKIRILLAGGDLPDMMNVDSSFVTQMIEGQQVIPLDKLLEERAPNVLGAYPKRIEFSKKFFSNGTDQTYFLPCGAGTTGPDTKPFSGYLVRWDYYKELGYPEIKNEDDFLKLLSEMQKKHPETPEGKKVYGMGMFNDWGMWSWWIGNALINGQYNWGPNAYLYDVLSNDIIPTYTDTTSPLWKNLEYLFKANQMGLLDPDSFTMKQSDFNAKSSNGQYLTAMVNWSLETYYKEQLALNPEFKGGYQALPVDGTFSAYNLNSQVGQTNKLMAITTNCKEPERAADYLDFMFSEEGCRLMYSGIEGVHWDTVKGKPTLKQETIDLFLKGGDEFSKQIGSAGYVNILGIRPATLSTKDNAPLSLFKQENVWKTTLTPSDKEYCEYYGVEYPYQVIENKISEGKMKDYSTALQDIPNAMSQAPDDIKRIDAKLDEIMFKGLPKVVLAKSPEEFKTNQAKVLAELKEAGADTSVEWWTNAWNTAKAFIES